MRLLIAVFLVRVQDEELESHPDPRVAFFHASLKSIEFHAQNFSKLIYSVHRLKACLQSMTCQIFQEPGFLPGPSRRWACSISPW